MHQTEQNIRRRHELELAGPFVVVLAVLTLIAFIIPLRPETSMREKRRLHEFPAFSADALLSGEYFDGISLWFSDTFPGRETLLEVSDRIDALHGLNRNEVVLTQTAQNDNADLDALLAEAEAAAAARHLNRRPNPSPTRTRSSSSGPASTARTRPASTAISWSSTAPSCPASALTRPPPTTTPP